MGFEIKQGDCLEVLPTLAACSIDACVTDPPYELGFMGKAWDKSGIAYSVDLWREVLRVLKPGGHLLAFGGSRTYHRLAVAIEDAGFEIRDQIQWIYGSGFPKSLDVSKAIDKHGGHQVSCFGEWLRKWRAERGITQKEVAALFPSKTGGLTGCVANWELGFNMPTPEQFNLICKTFELPFDSIEQAEREVVGVQANAMSGWSMDGKTKFADRDITAPATEAAKQWDGWGTALKPAHEPICVARKPLEGTVAQNVLKWGVGALNIDGCRIETNGDKLDGGRISTRSEGWDRPWKHDEQAIEACRERGNAAVAKAETLGRFPANVIHDGSDEVLAGFPQSTGGGGHWANKASGFGNRKYHGPGEQIPKGGNVARFFYTAKASQAERNRGHSGHKFNGAELVVWYNHSEENTICHEKSLTNSERSARHQKDTVLLPLKVICECGTESKSVTEWSTSSSGKESTVQFLKAIRSIIETGTNSITTSQTWNLSALLHTSESTAAAQSLTENGINRAASAELSTPLVNITNELRAFLRGANLAASRMQLQINVKENRCDHPTVKPIDLMRYLCRLVTPPGGLILDLFNGSGSTGIAAIAEGFNYLGIEIDADYIAISERRIRNVQVNLF